MELVDFWIKFGNFRSCPLKGQPVRTNRWVRSDFCGSTELSAWRGHPVSFNTTDDGWRGCSIHQKKT